MDLLDGVETLARAIHEDYVRRQRRKGRTPETNPSMVDWEDLPANLKESNRQQAADIGAKLATVGCDAEPRTDPGAEPVAFTAEEVELLAEMEHDRWVKEREANGWRLGPEKDVERKTTPHLIPWDELPLDIREYDRNTVRGLPAFLAEAGFSVVRAK